MDDFENPKVAKLRSLGDTYSVVTREVKSYVCSCGCGRHAETVAFQFGRKVEGCISGGHWKYPVGR